MIRRNPSGPGPACFLPAILALAGALLAGGCQAPAQTKEHAPTSTVASSATLRSARVVAQGGEGREIGIGAGQSMQPYYAGNTVLVITPVKWEDLQAGMNVVYTDAQGHRIAHTLLYSRGSYWVAGGANNAAPDTTRVTPQNLVGVVYGSFQSAEPVEPK